jgi:hypothetical protein
MSNAVAIRAITPEAVERALGELRETSSGTGKSVTMDNLARYAVPLEEIAAEDRAVPLLLIVDNVDALPNAAFVAFLNAAATRQQFSDLVDVLSPSQPVPPPATVEQARRNAEARAAFLAEFPTLSSSEVANVAGSRSRNRAALAHGWRKQNRIFAVPVGREQRYPLFQFDSEAGEPKAAVAQVISLLRSAGLGGWQIALWFSGTLARLDDRRPVDVLDIEPERVIEAAGTVQDIPY